MIDRSSKIRPLWTGKSGVAHSPARSPPRLQAAFYAYLDSKGVDPDLCERVLRLLYGQPQELTPENVLTFVHLGDFYGISQLQKHTESLLETFVTVDASNCCAKLAEAAALRCTQAQLHCRRILLSDFAAALKQPAFPSLELPVLAEVLEPDELLCEKVRTSARVMSSSSTRTSKRVALTSFWCGSRRLRPRLT